MRDCGAFLGNFRPPIEIMCQPNAFLAFLPLSRARTYTRTHTMSNGYWPATVNNQVNQSRSRSSRFYKSMSELGDNRDGAIIRTPLRGARVSPLFLNPPSGYIRRMRDSSCMHEECVTWVIVSHSQTSLHLLMFDLNNSDKWKTRSNSFI